MSMAMMVHEGVSRKSRNSGSAILNANFTNALNGKSGGCRPDTWRDYAGQVFLFRFSTNGKMKIFTFMNRFYHLSLFD